MRDFIAIDFETANPKRVSACAVGWAKVADGEVVETMGHLIKPVGGHAPFQSRIHGIAEEHTCDKPDFAGLLPAIQEIFSVPLVGYSQFDKQVLNALVRHFGLRLDFTYTDACGVAKDRLPTLRNHKLKTVAKHFDLPKFRHHDAAADADACARIFLKLENAGAPVPEAAARDASAEFRGLVRGILADDEVNYKEACELLYWLDDHPSVAEKWKDLRWTTMNALEDGHLDQFESAEMKMLLRRILAER